MDPAKNCPGCGPDPDPIFTPDPDPAPSLVFILYINNFTHFISYY